MEDSFSGKKQRNKAFTDSSQAIFRKPELLDSDRNQLIKNHENQVLRIAHHYHRANHRYDLEDLVQEGKLGLVKAIEKYDVDHISKASFNTFAFNYIRAEIDYFVKTKGKLIHIPLLK